MQKLKDEIREKKRQIRVLEQRMIGSFETTIHASNSIELSQVSTHLVVQVEIYSNGRNCFSHICERERERERERENKRSFNMR